MPQDSLNEREFELVNIVGAQMAANQRELSRQMDLSLGMTNMLLKRLITKGYIRIKQLDRRKVEYILTPKGFAEKMQKSVKYTLKTIHSMGLIHNQLDAIIGRLYAKEYRNFLILGHSDLAKLVEMSLTRPQWVGVKFSHIEQLPQVKFDGIVLICKEDQDPGQFVGIDCVDMIKELAHEYSSHS